MKEKTPCIFLREAKEGQIPKFICAKGERIVETKEGLPTPRDICGQIALGLVSKNCEQLKPQVPDGITSL